jgi:AcrR family transcriptional regulator
MPPSEGARRNKGFEATHDAVIAAAVRLISEKGGEALSMAAIARAVGINRTTLYYHFDDRDALLRAVKIWSAGQLAKGVSPDVPQSERIDYITGFVLDNPELIKLWIEEFLAPGDIRDRYPEWDRLVAGITTSLGGAEGETVDAEVYCVIMLTAAFIAPRVFKNSVRPDLDTTAIVERFRREQQRVLRHDALLRS